MEIPDWNSLFDKFASYRIMVIGDAMVDSYLWGRVTRISPEAPIPIVASTKREYRLGGAANVALNLHALGARPVLCSMIGQDPEAETFLERMGERGLATEGILQGSERKTTLKTRVISSNQQLIRVDEEDDAPLNENDSRLFVSLVMDLLNGGSIQGIVFEDYDKGLIGEKLIRQVVEAAKKKRIPVLVDPKKRNFHHYHGVDLFKPNLRELAEGMKADLHKSDFEAIHLATVALMAKNKISQVLVTLSEFGILYTDGSGYEVIPSQVREITDVSGAGDTVISVAALCRVAGLSLRDTARLANLAGGLVCEKVGVVPVNREELLSACIRFCK